MISGDDDAQSAQQWGPAYRFVTSRYEISVIMGIRAIFGNLIHIDNLCIVSG